MLQPKPRMGSEGEDIRVDAQGVEHAKMPTRFGVTTVKGAAWTILEFCGPEGLSIQEIAKRIQKSGLKDFSTSKTPEASLPSLVPCCQGLHEMFLHLGTESSWLA